MPRNDGKAPRGPNQRGLHRIQHSVTQAWECRVCHYKPNVDKVSEFCINCGRDFWGNSGTIPDEVTRDGT